MASDTEVREWAQENGKPVSSRGRVATAVREEYDAAHPLDVQDDGETAIVIELPADPEGGVLPPEEGVPAAPRAPRRPETPPQGKRTSRWQRKERTPVPKGKTKRARVSVATLGSWAWGLGGMALTQFPNATPVGRCLMIQAPVAGEVIDDLAKGTILDSVLQPLARGSEKAEKAFALVGPPVLVSILTSRPELAPALTPILKTALLSWVEVAGPAMVKAQAKAERLSEAMAGVDVDAMIAAMFADMPAAEPSPDEEAAIRRAANGNG